MELLNYAIVYFKFLPLYILNFICLLKIFVVSLQSI